jgi:hypothetical protein
LINTNEDGSGTFRAMDSEEQAPPVAQKKEEPEEITIQSAVDEFLKQNKG